MITFRQHLEISKNSDNEGGLMEYIDSLSPEEKIVVLRGIESTYPIKMNQLPSDSIYEGFTVYDNIMDLALGQFIMIEQIVTGKTQYKTEAENDLAIAQLILRPKTDKEFDNEDPKKEEQNKENILNSDVKDVYGSVMKFLRDRENVLFKQFSGVFYEINDDDEEEEEDNAATGQALFQQQWYWYSIVRMLAQEDITRYSEIYMLKMATVMPEMSYLAQKKKIEDASQRQQQLMRKL
jgi:hypothetical protein